MEHIPPFELNFIAEVASSNIIILGDEGICDYIIIIMLYYIQQLNTIHDNNNPNNSSAQMMSKIIAYILIITKKLISIFLNKLRFCAAGLIDMIEIISTSNFDFFLLDLTTNISNENMVCSIIF